MPPTAPNPWVRPDRPLVIAHRGQSVDAPEQTLAAFRRAVGLGAEMIEADVRRTADGRLVMLHDATVDRTTSGHGRLSDLTLDEVGRLDAGTWFDPGFAGEIVPRLDDLFALAAESGVALCLEAKGETSEENRIVAQEVAREIERRGRTGIDVLSSFDHAALLSARHLVAGLVVAPDRLPERGPSLATDSIRQAQAIGALIIQHHHEDLDPAVVAGLHEAGIAVWAWPTTRSAAIARSRDLGVDGLMGDDVAAIVEALPSV